MGCRLFKTLATMTKISVLCVDENSNYDLFPHLDLWKKSRNAYNFNGDNPVITHAPCQQWSKLKALAKPDKQEKDLAYFCYSMVNKNGGIFEHPAGSSFFNEVNADFSKIYSVNLNWFGFPSQKRTYLYVHNVRLLAMPLNFTALSKSIQDLHSSQRSKTPIRMITWMQNSIMQTPCIHSELREERHARDGAAAAGENKDALNTLS